MTEKLQLCFIIGGLAVTVIGQLVFWIGIFGRGRP